ncbi:MAG: hypothetical protein AAF487_11150 [Bacteroidota bacterium]
MNHYFQWSAKIGLVITGFFLFFFISLLSYRSLYKAVAERPAVFVNRFMASLVIKLFLFILLVIITGKALVKPESTYFILFFMGLYVIYMIFYSSYIMRLKDNGAKTSE